MRIGAIVLAAGRSTRFEGGNKLLAEIEGMPIIRHVLLSVSDAAVEDIILVVGDETGASIKSAAGAGRWRSIVNTRAAEGLSASVHAGLSALKSETDGAFVVLADMPGIKASLFNKMIEAFENANGEIIVYPRTNDGRQGNPVLWPKSLFGELLTLTGDRGGKDLILRYADKCVTIDAGTDAALDIDTQDDLAKFRRRLE